MILFYEQNMPHILKKFLLLNLKIRLKIIFNNLEDNKKIGRRFQKISI